MYLHCHNWNRILYTLFHSVKQSIRFISFHFSFLVSSKQVTYCRKAFSSKNEFCWNSILYCEIQKNVIHIILLSNPSLIENYLMNIVLGKGENVTFFRFFSLCFSLLFLVHPVNIMLAHNTDTHEQKSSNKVNEIQRKKKQKYSQICFISYLKWHSLSFSSSSSFHTISIDWSKVCVSHKIACHAIICFVTHANQTKPTEAILNQKLFTVCARARVCACAYIWSWWCKFMSCWFHMISQNEPNFYTIHNCCMIVLCQLCHCAWQFRLFTIVKLQNSLCLAWSSTRWHSEYVNIS